MGLTEKRRSPPPRRRFAPGASESSGSWPPSTTSASGPLRFAGRIRDDVVRTQRARRGPRAATTSTRRQRLACSSSRSSGCSPMIRTGHGKPLEEVARRWTHRGLSLQRVMEHMQSTFIDLYAGDGKRAWDRLNQWWPELRASHLLRLEQMRIQMFHLRAACAIQAARRDRFRSAAGVGPQGRAQDRAGARAMGGARGQDDSCGARRAPRRSVGRGGPAGAGGRPTRGPRSRPVCSSGTLAAGAPAWRSKRAAG